MELRKKALKIVAFHLKIISTWTKRYDINYNIPDDLNQFTQGKWTYEIL